MTKAAIRWFGLGALGAPLAARLHAVGYPLGVFDPDPVAMVAHRQACGPDTASGSVAAVYITCVTDEAAADALYFGSEGLIGRMPEGALAIDHTTTAPGFARRVAKALGARGIGFVDCPLSGGVAGARGGALLAMLGGRAADCERAAAILPAYCARIAIFGPPGSGQAAKLANQLAIAGTLAGLHAASRFARLQGLAVGPLFEALSAGSAHSAQMDQHAAALAAGDMPFGQRFGWIAKDLELAAAETQSEGRAPDLPAWLLRHIAQGA